jgi:tetratricopeptide (TPR) repeat protein
MSKTLPEIMRKVVMKLLFKNTLLGILVLLTACQATDIETEVYQEDALPSNENIATTIEDSTGRIDIIRARIIADILFEAKYAFDDNQLMSPPGDNAYDRYQEVLEIYPDNAVALEGINEIIVRYTELADIAMGNGQYDNAESLLARAASIDDFKVFEELIDAGKQRLELARSRKIDKFDLDGEALRDQSLEMLVQLAEIGDYVKDKEATMLITARTDEEGRWIYRIMREAVGGFRLRGDIIVGDPPSVQVILPKS